KPPLAVLVDVGRKAIARRRANAAIGAADALLGLLRDDPRRERAERMDSRVDLRGRDGEAGMPQRRRQDEEVEPIRVDVVELVRLAVGARLGSGAEFGDALLRGDARIGEVAEEAQ